MLIYLKTTQNQDNAELFVNCLEAMVETCLPGADDLDVPHTCYPGALGAISSNLNLSSSMSSISLGSIHSPTDRGGGGSGSAGGGGPDGMSSLIGCSAADCLGGLASTAILRGRHGSASHVSKHRGGSVKRDSTGGAAGGSGGPNKSDSLGWAERATRASGRASPWFNLIRSRRTNKCLYIFCIWEKKRTSRMNAVFLDEKCGKC